MADLPNASYDPSATSVFSSLDSPQANYSSANGQSYDISAGSNPPPAASYDPNVEGMSTVSGRAAQLWDDLKATFGQTPQQAQATRDAGLQQLGQQASAAGTSVKKALDTVGGGINLGLSWLKTAAIVVVGVAGAALIVVGIHEVNRFDGR